MHEYISVMALMFVFILFFAIIVDPEGVAESFEKFVYGMHRTFVRIWSQIEFRVKNGLLHGAGIGIWLQDKFKKKRPVKLGDKVVGQVTKTEYNDGGMIATMRIDDPMVRKMIQGDIGNFSIFDDERRPDAFIEDDEGNRSALDLKKGVVDGVISPNTARRAIGLPTFRPIPPLAAEGFGRVAKSFSQAGASLAQLSKKIEDEKQARFSGCKKHKFHMKGPHAPILLMDRPTGLVMYNYRCRICGMPWEVPQPFFQKRGYIKDLPWGREPMGSTHEFITICKQGEICDAHARTHGDWKCIRKE